MTYFCLKSFVFDMPLDEDTSISKDVIIIYEKTSYESVLKKERVKHPNIDN
jgi:hypothetical protein